MQKFNYFMPTKIIFGHDVVKDAGTELALGTKALIVTGQSSAKRSGALDDVLAVLSTDYVIFDEVENNPTVETVVKGAKFARANGCDYVIAIGGGSPLDAAKVMAVATVNEGDPLEFYQTGWSTPALPMVAIPTTAGTGSEVTQYAVLTLFTEETKKGLGGPDLFPKVAYLDPKYTASLSKQVTIDTAVDALSHLVEGYLAERATAASDLVALEGIALWGTAISALREGEFDLEARKSLLLASTLGGITIAQTGTTLVHALGYPLTYFHNMPHGRANGILMAAYLRYSQEHAPERVAKILKLLGLASLTEFSALMDTFFVDYLGELEISDETVQAYIKKAQLTSNIKNSLGNPSGQELTEIFQASIME